MKKKKVAGKKEINQSPHILTAPSYSPSSKENSPGSGKLLFSNKRDQLQQCCFYFRRAHITQDEKCYWDLEVTQHHWKEVRTWHSYRIQKWKAFRCLARLWPPLQILVVGVHDRASAAQGQPEVMVPWLLSSVIVKIKHTWESGDTYIRRWWKGPKPGSQPIHEILWEKNILTPVLLELKHGFDPVRLRLSRLKKCYLEKKKKQLNNIHAGRL